MLFMGICTWEPDKRDKVRKAFGEVGTPPGKMIGMWSDIGGCRAFWVFENDDPKSMVTTSNSWSDIATVELIPLIDSTQLMKLVASKK